MATILVVDDRPTNRELLVTLLGYASHRVLEAAEGEAGLAIARAEHPDLIITDIVMPTMDGYEFARQVRADPTISETQIIFHTSSYIVTETRHNLYRYALGAEGKADVLGTDWSWIVRGNRNVSKFYNGTAVPITANYNAAIDAVRGLIFVRGSVPGHKGGWLLVKDSVKIARPDTAPYPAGIRALAGEIVHEEAPAGMVEEAALAE